MQSYTSKPHLGLSFIIIIIIINIYYILIFFFSLDFLVSTLSVVITQKTKCRFKSFSIIKTNRLFTYFVLTKSSEIFVIASHISKIAISTSFHYISSIRMTIILFLNPNLIFANLFIVTSSKNQNSVCGPS